MGVGRRQAGGGVFCDVHYAKDFGVDHPYALSVMTTVTSRPTPERVITDAGGKFQVEHLLPGWYSIKVSGTFVSGPHSSEADCLRRIAEINPPPVAKKRVAG